MTHRTAATARICPNCDGFATAAMTTGSRDRHGHLRTITVDCRACNGLGTVQPRPVREGARV
jgi:RNase P subunit RPR2